MTEEELARAKAFQEMVFGSIEDSIKMLRRIVNGEEASVEQRIEAASLLFGYIDQTRRKFEYFV